MRSIATDKGRAHKGVRKLIRYTGCALGIIGAVTGIGLVGSLVSCMLLFYPDNEELTLYRRGRSKYASVKPDSDERYAIDEVETKVTGAKVTGAKVTVAAETKEGKAGCCHG